MSNATSAVSSALTNTLVLALAQCEDQNRRLFEQREFIEQLKQENESLRRELKQERARSSGNIEAKYTAQFQEAFRQVAEKQAEVDHLKEKLRAAKAKARRGGVTDLSSSSPALPLAEHQRYIPRTLPSPILSGQAEADTEDAHPLDENVDTQPSTEQLLRKRSRSRSQSRPPLQELDPNVNVEQGRTDLGKVKRRRKLRKEDSDAAIPEIAEDGDDYLYRKRKLALDGTAKVLPGSVYNRLGNLLDAKEPRSPRLLGEASSSLAPANKSLSESTPSRTSSATFGLLTPSTDVRSKRPKSSVTAGKQTGLPRLEQKPLRSKPVEQLRLIDFKLNPATNSGLEHAYNETIRGEERKCLPGCTRECCVNTFRALAATLPGLPGGNGQQISDHELLLRHLGLGSEEKIRNLTPKARENLVHDARTKLVADAYGKMHRDVHERGRSPPGFWRTDMPGSQEAREDRAQAETIEREEIKKRYHEATREGGRWIFADE